MKELFVVALSTIKVLDDSFGHTRFASSSFHLRYGHFRHHDWNHEGDGLVVGSNDSLCPNAQHRRVLIITIYMSLKKHSSCARCMV